MAIQLNRNANLMEFYTTATDSNDMSFNTKNFTVGTGLPFTVNDNLAMYPTAAKLPGGLFMRINAYNSTTGALTLFPSTTYGLTYDAVPLTACQLDAATITTVTNPGLGLVAGDGVLISRVRSTNAFSIGTVATYNNTTGELTVTRTSGTGVGTLNDLRMVSFGTFTSWDIGMDTTDTLTINGSNVLTIDQMPNKLLGRFSVLSTGKINIVNTSTTTMLNLMFNAHTNQGFTIAGKSELNIQGEYIEIGTGNNSSGQTFDLSSYGLAFPTHIEVETASGSGVYKKWFISADGRTGAALGYQSFSEPTNWGTGDKGNIFFFNPVTKVLKVGDNVNGATIPTGAKVRMPNISLDTAQLISYSGSDINTTGTTLLVPEIFFTASGPANFFVNERTLEILRRGAHTSNTLTLNSRNAITRNLETNIGFSSTINGAINQAIVKGDKLVHYRNPGGISPFTINHGGGGILNIDKCQIISGQINSDNPGNTIIKNFGTGYILNTISNSTNIVTIENCSFQCGLYMPLTAGANYPLNLINTVGDVSLSDLIFASFIDGIYDVLYGFTRLLNIQNALNIVKFEKIYLYHHGPTSTNICVFNYLAMKNPNYEINEIYLINASINLQNSSNVKFNKIYFGSSLANIQGLNAYNCTSSSTTESVTLGTVYDSTVVPRTGSVIRLIAGTGPTTSTFATISTTPNQYVVKVSDTEFKLAACPRFAYDNITLDLTNNVTGSYTERSITNAFVLQGVNNINIRNVSTFCNSQYNVFVFADAASSNISIYDVNFEGDYNLSYITQNSSLNLKIYNSWFGELRPRRLATFGDHRTIDYSTAIGIRIYNVRYTGEIGNYTVTSGLGVATSTDAEYNFLTSPITLVSGAAFAPNYLNAGPIYNLVDFGLNPTTGGITYGPLSLYNNNTVQLTGNAFLDNAGRLFMPSLNDSAVITSKTYMKGITGFRNLTPYFFGTNQSNMTFEFALKNQATDWGAYQTLNFTNLDSAFNALDEYSSDFGLLIRLRITTITANVNNTVINGKIYTTVDPDFVYPDAIIPIVGSSSTDIIELRKDSDDTLVSQRIGDGNIESISGVDVYVVRKTSTGIVIYSTKSDPTTPVQGINPIIYVYTGDEIQIAQAPEITEIKTAVYQIPTEVWAYSLNGKTAGNRQIDSDDNAELAAIK